MCVCAKDSLFILGLPVLADEDDCGGDEGQQDDDTDDAADDGAGGRTFDWETDGWGEGGYLNIYLYTHLNISSHTQ